MAAPILVTNSHDVESDYGSDFSVEEESIVIQLLEDIHNSKDSFTDTVEQTTSFDPVLQADLDAAIAADLFVTEPIGETSQQDVVIIAPHNELLSRVKIPAGRQTNLAIGDIEDGLQVSSLPLDGIRYPDPPKEPNPEGIPKADNRSPVERFRSFPKKPLTVTDISSGAWCELQYWYTLTLLPGGRKARTAAMKGGTKVHQKLEDEVHTTIQVNVTLKEEAFALRLWNLIQGLRTLRDRGFTRELEVWGIVEGQVINGVIDELSFTSPNAGIGEEIIQSQPSQDSILPAAEKKQSSITNYFDPHRRRVFLTDVKTRGSNRLPSGAALRPSKVQLFLYHHLLGKMVAGRLDFSSIVARYGLQLDARFSDTFMAQIGSLHDEVFDDVEPGEDIFSAIPTSRDRVNNSNVSSAMDVDMSPRPDLMRYRSIQQILPLLQSELETTFPNGAESLGDQLAVVYRHRDDGRVIGSHSFSTDAEALSKYLKLNLAWWLGKRTPDGVPVDEAYKCRLCEFAASCDWRKERDEEIVRKFQKSID